MPLVTNDVGGSGYGSPTANIPHDWTEGTGVIPAAGITIPAPSASGQSRKWLLIQNQSGGTINVGVQALNAQGAVVTANILLASGGVAGTQGGAQEFGRGSWNPNSPIVITGAGLQALVLEVLE